MDNSDNEFWEEILELTGKKEWKTFIEDAEAQQQALESKMIHAENWDEFLETRGQYRMYNYLLNLRWMAENFLEGNDEE